MKKEDMIHALEMMNIAETMFSGSKHISDFLTSEQLKIHHDKMWELLGNEPKNEEKL